MSRKLIIETDGAARGNPGFAGAGIVIKDDTGRRLQTIQRYLGVTTNNQAEYRALIDGLRAALHHRPDTVTVRMDSELVVKQMTGQYRVRHPEILPLYLEAVDAVTALPEVTFEHVSRERNREADDLANVAIDSRMVRGRGAGVDER
ncbi:MAG TPA: ribonuclease HI family protein [Chloroflexota bacterium]|nr:ribonuclease HI family protein [Chloroflexota bacterium]